MKMLVARYPEQSSWLNFPYFYAKARAELGAFADVDDRVLSDPERPIGENFDLAPYCGIVSFGGRFAEACVESAPDLKVVSGFQCGEDVLAAKGIRFVELSGGWMRTVAELGIGLTLSVLRNIAPWHSQVQSNHETWIMEQFTDDPNFVNGELYGKRVGIFGLGRIGRYYADLAQAFKAELAAYDPYLSDDVFADAEVKRMDLDSLLEWSQIFVVASAPTAESTGVINRDRIYKLRRGSALIVISRALPLDMQAVRDRIGQGEICGGFDVYDTEPLRPDDVLRRSANVTLTPHVGGRCSDSNRLMAEMVVTAFRETLLGT